MKYTNIYEDGTDYLVLAFCSEVTWIPLNVGEFIEREGELGKIVRKVFNIEHDTMELHVQWLPKENL